MFSKLRRLNSSIDAIKKKSRENIKKFAKNIANYFKLVRFKQRVLMSMPIKILKQIADDYGLSYSSSEELRKNISYNIPLETLMMLLDHYTKNTPYHSVYMKLKDDYERLLKQLRSGS